MRIRLLCKATNKQFSDVETGGATDLIRKSVSTKFMALNANRCINIYKLLFMHNNELSGITTITVTNYKHADLFENDYW